LGGQAVLHEHKLIYGQHKPIVMPEDDSILEFEVWAKTQRHPIIIYTDFEALQVKANENKGNNTKMFQLHKPIN